MAIYFGSTDSKISGALGRAVKAGKMRRIASRIYTDDLKVAVEDLVRRHRWEILAHFYPGSGCQSPVGFSRRMFRLRANCIFPGLAAAAQEDTSGDGDLHLAGAGRATRGCANRLGLNEALFASGQARAILENMQIERARGDDEAKILSREQIESWLDAD